MSAETIVRSLFSRHGAKYSPVFFGAYLFTTIYAVSVFIYAMVILFTTLPATNTEYGVLVADRLMSGRIYALPVFFLIFQYSFWKQKYFFEVLIACAAWLASTYLEDYFALGGRFHLSYLWPSHILLAMRPLLLIAILWMILEHHAQR